MAPDDPTAGNAGLEHQDQSIKDRKFQLFEEPKSDGDGEIAVRKPFSHYVRVTPPAPMTSGIKASIWAAAIVVALLFLVAMFGGGGKKHRRRHASLPPGRIAAVAWHLAASGQTFPRTACV